MERKLMKGAPRKAIMDLVNKSIDESSISSEASACALMTEAVSIMLADIARLVMKLCDKGKAEGVLSKIERYIDRFKEQGRFTQEDYERFILR